MHINLFSMETVSSVRTCFRQTTTPPQLYRSLCTARSRRTNHIFASITNQLDSLKEIDRLLSKDYEPDAVKLAESLKAGGELKAFGNTRQVPKRSYTLEELRLNKIDPRQFLAPEDNTLTRVRRLLQASYLAGLTAAFFGHTLDMVQLVQTVILSAALLTADQVANAGGLEALVVDSAARILTPSYAKRVALHESGHFLVAYLLGLLPKGYSLSSLELFLQ